VGINADLPRLLRGAIAVCYDFRLRVDRRHMYRSILPFLPPSSPVFGYYNKLSDPIRVLRVGESYKDHVPSNITPQPNEVLKGNDTPTTPTACAALSDDGRQVALGFRDGVVEVVDVERGVVTSRFLDGPQYPLVWLLFVSDGRQLVTENSEGDIYLLDTVTLRRLLFASPSDGAKRVMSSLSHDGSMIVRLATHSGEVWYKNMSIIHISKDGLTINALSAPSLHPPNFTRAINTLTPSLQVDSPTSRVDKEPNFPLRRSLGFSPDGRYVAAFDAHWAIVWSSASFQVIAQYSIDDPRIWFLNTNRLSVTSPAKSSDQPVVTLDDKPSGSISSSCVLFTLQRRSDRFFITETSAMEMVSRATGAVPLLPSQGGIWLRGHKIAIIPAGYRDPNSCSDKLPSPPRTFSWFGDSLTEFTLPTSRDGTRFLVCDEEGIPIIVDVSRLITRSLAK
jgi:hypothetical protein